MLVSFFSSLFRSPRREWVVIVFLVIAFALGFVFQDTLPLLLVFSVLALAPTLWQAMKSVGRGRLDIDVFNSFAIIVSFAAREYRSAGFIALMLTFARLLDHATASRTRQAMEALMALKPATALREQDGVLREIDAASVRAGDVLLVKPGSRVPVDGEVVDGSAEINEASVTGESRPVHKMRGDLVISATMVETGAIKMRATRVGRDSTIERMAALMQEAASHKSHSEKLADRFAGIFLPFVALFGIGVYAWTHDLRMTASLFLVACADDMAVAIPLAMTASLGMAARRGVIIKGGEWLDALARMRTLVLDKTGTLTFGAWAVGHVKREKTFDEKTFWTCVGSAEKFSEHSLGKAAYRRAKEWLGADPPDPESFESVKGYGVRARAGDRDVVIGNAAMMERDKFVLPPRADHAASFYVFIDGAYAGCATVDDAARPEAAASIRRLRALGVTGIWMYTGDEEETAQRIARSLGITNVRARMKPEDKMRSLEALMRHAHGSARGRGRGGSVGMVGDGINDAPALARADVGIAMGGGGTAIAAEAADVVILSDNLLRLPEMIELGRRTRAVIWTDIFLWLATNAFGFFLVLTGFAGPALAAFYNFATDFIPLLNSTRLFSKSNAKH